ncbi:MAG: hypothetical protein E6H00_05765 [Bacillati bacterium ANGP1]|uniref:Uncharacterized protein n=1 Tax=Candidatus Segetimicrobium genomatis TaxID=2569760 RepID=A0A537K5Y1_9BACT|nr:MAG: hypothetical protein E6H00_05765 [Terrabacteria group bacterium ANGP1]
MARPNYSSLKRAKELKRKAKRDAKLARKLARRASSDPAEPAPAAPPDDWTQTGERDPNAPAGTPQE